MEFVRGKSVDLELDMLLSVNEIRAHTKTNDIPTVTDAQLELYRTAAFEAAEQYTGQWFRGTKWVEETVRPRRKPGHRVHNMRWPTRDGRVFVHIAGVSPYTEFLNPGAKKVAIRDVTYSLTFNHCCNPCATDEADRVMYYTGLKCAADFPAGVAMGMLKYIAYNMSNPGDIQMVWTNDRRQAAARQVLNDAVEASGAAAEWRRYAVVT